MTYRTKLFGMLLALVAATGGLLTWTNYVKSKGLLQQEVHRKARSIGNRTVVTVVEENPNVSVRFERICRNEAGNRFQGYITVGSVLGSGGFHTIAVDHITEGPIRSTTSGAVTAVLIAQAEQSDTSDPSPDTSLVSILTREIPQSLHRAETFTGARLVSDIQVQPLGGPDTKSADLVISRVNLVTDRGTEHLTFEADPREASGVVKNVPVSTAAALQFVMSSGTVITSSVGGLGLKAVVEPETILNSDPEPSAWRAVVAAAGGIATGPTASVSVSRVREWQLSTVPVYGPLKGADVSIEDAGESIDELNEAVLTGNRRRLQEVFGTDQPIQITWSFQATNLTTGALVPVQTSPPASDLPSGKARTLPQRHVHVRLLPGRVPNGTIRVSFPTQPRNVVYGLLATATLTDSNGMTATLQRPLWSHVLSGNPESLADFALRAAADLAGVPQDELVAAASTLDDDRPSTDSGSRVARMVRLTAMEAAKDGHVSIDALNRLIRGAIQFRETGSAEPPPTELE
jgi:hypothetical protein